MKILNQWYLINLLFGWVLFFLLETNGLCMEVMSRGVSQITSMKSTKNLYASIDQGNVDEFRTLLFQTELIDGIEEYLIDVNACSKGHGTVLMYIINCEKKDFVQIILQRGDLDVNQASNTGNTALHYAVQMENAAIVELLLAHPKTKRTLKNDQGHTAKHYAKKNKAIKDLFDSSAHCGCILL